MMSKDKKPQDDHDPEKDLRPPIPNELYNTETVPLRQPDRSSQAHLHHCPGCRQRFVHTPLVFNCSGADLEGRLCLECQGKVRNR